MNRFLKYFLCVLCVFLFSNSTIAYDFNVLVIPTDLFNVCDNYYCFETPSEILANNINEDLGSYKHIATVDIYTVRNSLENNLELKEKTRRMLENYKSTDEIDFKVLTELANLFKTKSIMLISTYVTTDKTPVRRNIWELLELTSAFKINYDFKLNTNVVLTDNVNSIIMWSNKYSKNLSNNDNYFISRNMTQATSQLEKIKLYYSQIIAPSVSQNVAVRLFPKSVRPITLQNPSKKENAANALQYSQEQQHMKNPTDKSLLETDMFDDTLFSY